MPLRDGGVHRIPEPARAARRVLGATLEEFPDDLAARWLLNFSAMALGDYPGGVPERWRIPESVFASDVPFPRFREIGAAIGLAVSQLSGASVVDDFDGDQRLDVVVTSLGLTDPMRFYRNQGDGTFRERTREAGLEGLVGGLNAIQADYDNDGHLDVFVLRGAWFREEGRFPNSLLRNRGDGTFEDMTEAAGCSRTTPRRRRRGWTSTGTGGSTCSWATRRFRRCPGIPASCIGIGATGRSWRSPVPAG